MKIRSTSVSELTRYQCGLTGGRVTARVTLDFDDGGRDVVLQIFVDLDDEGQSFGALEASAIAEAVRATGFASNLDPAELHASYLAKFEKDQDEG